MANILYDSSVQVISPSQGLLTTHNTHNRQTSIPPTRFEPTTPTSEKSQTHFLDCAATGIGHCILIKLLSLFYLLVWRHVTLRGVDFVLEDQVARSCQKYCTKPQDILIKKTKRASALSFSRTSKDNSYNYCKYRVSQEECARLREGVPYVKVYRYNPKHLYPKLNGYGDNGQRKVGSSCCSKYCNLHSWYVT